MKLSRRQYTLAAASLSGFAADWRDEQGYDLDEVRTEGNGDVVWGTGGVTPLRLATSGHGPTGRWSVDQEQLDEVNLDVHYDAVSVELDLEGRAESCRTGYLATLEPEQAKQLAVALYTAAEDVEEGSQ